MCHYSAAKRGLVPRRLTASLIEETPTILSPERALPSKGMTLNQLQAVFGAIGQPALFYALEQMPTVRGVANPAPQFDQNGRRLPAGCWDTRIFSVICRYLNSGYPVLIGTLNHAFTIVGWFKEGDWIRFIANDDQRGPYEVIYSPFRDRRAPWRSIMVPLPPKVYLSGESAENSAHKTLRSFGAIAGAPQEWVDLAQGVETGELSIRTILRDCSVYKAELTKREIDQSAVRALRLARLPHFSWIVEVQDRVARRSGEPEVVAEILYDSTSHDRVPRRDAVLLPGMVMTYPPDEGTPAWERTGIGRWRSSLHFPE
jgi:hypothetical protein